MNTGVAVFVKTPGMSPLKTRLAAGIGEPAAIEFYNLAVETIKETLGHWMQSSDLYTAYWAVAEEDGLESTQWRDFPRIFQGDGGLDSRITEVYNNLIERHECAVLLGADAPQVDTLHLSTCQDLLQNKAEVVIGPAADGGFYLFASRKRLPEGFWNRVPYSTDNTCTALQQELRNLGLTFEMLEPLRDVDTAEDLEHGLAAQLAERPAAKQLRNWLETRA